MINIFSRYRPRYVRSLVYMLQASEYNVRDYLRWCHRTRDFTHVEKRKHLEKTPKALALLALAWTMIIAWVIAVMSFVGSTGSDVPLVVGAGVVFLLPFYLPYVILIPLALLQVIQAPIQAYLVNQAKRTLSKHPAVKIAIAGSYGKTSTREILKTVLSEGKKVAAPRGSYNTPLGIAAFVRALKGDEDVLIFELGEYYPGDVRKLARIINPEWGVITGVNEAHLEKFKSLERTADTIFELAEIVDSTKLYINGENELAKNRRKNGNILYSREGASTWQVSETHTDLSGTTFVLSNDISTLSVKTKLLGIHMIGPLVVAVDIAQKLGLTISQIERGIEKTKPFSHRLEPKKWTDDVTFLDDSYNGNPDGVRAAIAFLASLSGRRLYVTPGLVETGERVKEVHEEIGKELAKASIPKVVLIKNSVTPYIDAGLAVAGFKGEVLWYDDMPSCLLALRALALPGDIILVQNDWPDQYA